MCRPESYNDPFEGARYIEPNVSINLAIKAGKLNPDEAEEFIRIRKSSEGYMPLSTLFDNGRFRERLDYHQKIMRVASFCESPLNLLMWSHYAQCHEGFCVEYDTKELLRKKNLRHNLFPVTYQEDMFDESKFFKDNPIKNQDFLDYRVMATKSSHWSYENEWRLIFYDEVAPRYNFPVKGQVRILLGAKIEKSVANKIYAICSELDIECVQIEMSHRKYSLSEFPNIII